MTRAWVGRASMVALAAMWLWGAAQVWPDTVDRVAHPGRYATSGRATRDPAAYVAAARAALPPGARLARLVLPTRGGPVVVMAASPARIDLYLDPPTARVLATGGGWADGEAPPAEPAQSIDRVIRRARPYSGGGALRTVDWPTTRSPDWTVSFGGGVGARVKVADDSPDARPAPVRDDDAARLLRGLYVGSDRDWQIGMALAGVVLAVACLILWGWPTRRGRKGVAR